MSKIVLALILYFYIALAILVMPFVKLFASKKKRKSILFFAAFFPGNSGYNWRVKEWELLLTKKRFKVGIFHAIEKEEFYKYKDSNLSLFLIKFLNRRFWQVLKSSRYEKVIVRRELLLFNDYGNLFLEKLLLKIHPNAILDFDDDIAFAKKEPKNIQSIYGKFLLENGSKFTDSLSFYKNFIVGSQYLKYYVINRCCNDSLPNISIIPTCVNYESFEPKKYDIEKETVSFGWIGGNHNLFLLDNIIAPLNEISKKHQVELIVIAGRDYKSELAEFNIINKIWRLETEKADLKTIDIGLMPLNNTDRDKGKCSFKLIQYMGMGIVSIASSVGMNIEVLNEEKKEGFLVTNNWVQKFEEAILNRSNWKKIGQNARNRVLNSYSYKANLTKLVSFLNQIS